MKTPAERKRDQRRREAEGLRIVQLRLDADLITRALRRRHFVGLDATPEQEDAALALLVTRLLLKNSPRDD